jgi:hypothetical protein
MKAAPAPPWSLGPRGPALLEAAVRGGRLDRGTVLVLGDWLEENDRDRLAARVRSLARAGHQLGPGAPPAPPDPDGLEVRWRRGEWSAHLSFRAGAPWLPGPDGRGHRRLTSIAGYVTYGEGRRVPPERRPGRVYFVLRWYAGSGGIWSGLRHLPDPRRVYLDTPAWFPVGELAALAFDAAAAVLLARLLGRQGASGEAVVVTA